jgi:hypothetical protein
MKKLSKIYIVGLLAFLVSCKPEYKIPNVTSCALLSETVFCVDTETLEEFELPIKEAVGFACYPQEDNLKLEEFGHQLILDNIRFSTCKSKKCIRALVREINARDAK